MRIAGEAQATFDGDDRWLVSVFGGATVVGTTGCIRYVYPARGTKFRRRPPFVRVSRTGYDQRKLSVNTIVGTAAIDGKKFESCGCNELSLHEESEIRTLNSTRSIPARAKRA